MVSRRMAWRGEAAWVKVSDKVKTALSDDSVAAAAWSERRRGRFTAVG